MWGTVESVNWMASLPTSTYRKHHWQAQHLEGYTERPAIGPVCTTIFTQAQMWLMCWNTTWCMGPPCIQSPHNTCFFHSGCVHKVHWYYVYQSPGPAWEVGPCVKNRNATRVDLSLPPKDTLTMCSTYKHKKTHKRLVHCTVHILHTIELKYSLHTLKIFENDLYLFRTHYTSSCPCPFS